MTEYRSKSIVGRIFTQALVVGGLVLVFATTTRAEEIENLSVQEALQLCAAFSDKSERLQCFEALAEATAPTSTATAEDNEADMVNDGDASPNVPALAETPTAEPSPATPHAARPLEDDENLTFVRGKTGDEEKRASAGKRDRSDKERKRRTLTVYRSWRNALGELRIAFTNGEIWRQTSKGTRYDPQPGDKAEIIPSMFGGWRVSLDDGRHSARMRPAN
jgi:hypothetical protein